MLAQACKTAISPVFHELETSSYLESPGTSNSNLALVLSSSIEAAPPSGVPKSGCAGAPEPKPPFQSIQQRSPARLTHLKRKGGPNMNERGGAVFRSRPRGQVGLPFRDG